MGHDDDTADQVSALRATAHPVRLRMLSLLTQNPMSAAEVARELEISHANASYHLRVLLDADELVEAGEEKIRGGVAKRYRYPHERRGEHPNPGKNTPEDRVAYAKAVGQELQRRILQQERGHHHFHFDLEGWVPVETWERAVALISQASHLLHENNAAPHSPDTVHISATGWAFRMNQPDRQPDRQPEGDSS